MALPTFQALMRPVLEISQTRMKTREAVDVLANQLDLTEEDRLATTEKNGTNAFSGRVNWAITYLKMGGLVERPSKGEFVITSDGRELLRQHSGSIDLPFLKKNTKFLQHKAERKKQSEEAAELTPVEQLEQAYESINDAIKSELLEKILDQSPIFFERLVIKLLTAMGYGKAGEIAEAIGKSGDGGIDGIIYEDKLGLDIVYIQAKRYDPGNVIGRPALQSFIGSLSGFSATKGVFITTSSFSSNVEGYLQSVQQRVVTISGEQLVELMLQNGVGVRLQSTYELFKVDEDLFNE